MNFSKKDWVKIVVILWVFLIVGGYYYFHKPFTWETLQAPIVAFIDIVIAGLIVMAAGGIGNRLVKFEQMSPLERVTVQGALGLGIISLIWMVFGFLHLFNRWTAWILLGLVTVLLWKYSLDWLRNFSEIRMAYRSTGWLGKVLAAVCLLLAGMQFFIALAPTTSWDALSNHLQLPRIYLHNGFLSPISENTLSGYYQLGEMLFTLGMALHRPETAVTIGWAAGLLMLPGLYGITAHIISGERNAQVSSSAGWVAVFSVMAGETFRNLLGSAYTDQFSALFGCAAAICMIIFLETQGKRWFYWTAIFAGLALAAKLTSGALILGLVLVGWMDRKNARLRFNNWAVAVLAVLLPALPWIIKNLAFTGNPFFPYSLGELFTQSEINGYSGTIQSSQTWLERLVLPIAITWKGVHQAGIYRTDIGPLLLLLGIPGTIAGWKDSRLRAVFFTLLPTTLILGLGGIFVYNLNQTRLFFSLLPFLGLLAGIGWYSLQEEKLGQVRLRKLLGAVILLVAGISIIQDMINFSANHPFSVVMGTESKEDYRLSILGYHELAMREVNNLPTTAKVLGLFEPRGLYAPLTFQTDVFLDNFSNNWKILGNSDAVIQNWRSKGFTHVLVYQAGVDFLKETDPTIPLGIWQGLQETLGQLSVNQNLNDVYILYDLQKTISP